MFRAEEENDATTDFKQKMAGGGAAGRGPQLSHRQSYLPHLCLCLINAFMISKFSHMFRRSVSGGNKVNWMLQKRQKLVLTTHQLVYLLMNFIHFRISLLSKFTCLSSTSSMLLRLLRLMFSAQQCFAILSHHILGALERKRRGGNERQ